ncbi:TrkH family potassium uptake protein [Anaerosporobacter faecicola]|uniref:TrkH family potassium uptake protein n=1 Tax=Anaerosporobacter faecicola TaxID=2718714 RepID=UPI00143C3A53|nr:TrkH family potassium uptake protein [Anaerosporobacter faecicola]
MNYKAISKIIGLVLKFEAAFMLLPAIVAVIYQERAGIYFAITMFLCLLVGAALGLVSKKDTEFYAKEGFASVALSWIALSIFGALPFYLSGEIPSYTDALFETISGFTTTGASILSNVEALSHCMLFWRSFTHWLGGMGVLVFILAVLPLTGGYNMHLMRAESPGPQVGKLVPRVHKTATILYGIYVFITVVEIILLLIGKMPLFDAVTISFGTAGTGGFGIKNDSMAGYSDYIQNVVSIFMILFGVNFNAYFFLLLRKVKNFFRSEEVLTYFGIIIVSTIAIAINVNSLFPSFMKSLQHSLFQVASIITTTGFSTVDFDVWPEASKSILLLLMFIGACAGSTGGGIKVSRIIISIKLIKKEITTFIHPRCVKSVKMDGKVIDDETLKAVSVYFMTFVLVFLSSVLLLTFDDCDFITNFTAVSATINNIGPGLNMVGPTQNFGFFSGFCKYVLMFDMLVGRLELFPMLVLFSPNTWKKKQSA